MRQLSLGMVEVFSMGKCFGFGGFFVWGFGEWYPWSAQGTDQLLYDKSYMRFGMESMVPSIFPPY